jgi:hypothetical protein
MIEPRCPECLSPEIEPDPKSTTMRWRCGNCGERFDFETAFVQLREAEDFRSEMEPEPLFHLHRNLALIELRACDGALRALNPYSDAEELHRILDAALARRVIEARRPGAALHAYLLPGAEPHPVLGVDAGVGAELLGPRLALEQEKGEDPISYTVRWLERIVEAANDLLAGRLHRSSAGSRAADPGTVGPRSHRPTPGASPQRRYTAAGCWLRPDATMVPKVEADGFSIAAALAEFGERIEAGDRDPEAVALEVTVSWRDEASDDGQGAAR